MFYPVQSLKRGGQFYYCWLAYSWPDRFAAVTQRQLWSQNLGEICEDLLEVINNESGHPSNRFSLRLSTQLIWGLVRVYQRKVNDYMFLMCKLNANVLKSTHKRLPTEITGGNVKPPGLIIEEVEEEHVEEIFRNSRNVVARVQDITLREPTLPEIRVHIDDGFGELHPGESLLLLGDRSMEMMLARDVSGVQHSALDLPLDSMRDQSHDKSRLAVHDTVQMERVSEHEVSVFRKSGAEAATTLMDFEKDVPEISVLPPPDLSASQPANQDNQTALVVEVQEQAKDQNEIEKEKENETEEIVLEELSTEPQVKRRKLNKNKLIIDKSIKLSSNYLRARIGDHRVETRCDNITEENVIAIRTPATTLLSRPAHAGARFRTNFGSKLGALFERKSADSIKARVAGGFEKPRRTLSPKLGTSVQQVTEPMEKRVHEHEVLDPTVHDMTAPNILLEVDAAAMTSRGHEPMDISDLATQKILTLSVADKSAAENPKRPRRCDYVFHKALAPLDVTANEADKENIPDAGNIPSVPVAVKQQEDVDYLRSLLQEAGMNDVPADLVMANSTDHKRTTKGTDSDITETPLGSLDRTKVSLGDSVRTTDTLKFIREEWGGEGTMIKILYCVLENIRPINVESLVARGPVIEGQRRMIAAKCFTSILKLKQNGFIRIHKFLETNGIKDIDLGPRLKLYTQRMHYSK